MDHASGEVHLSNEMTTFLIHSDSPIQLQLIQMLDIFYLFFMSTIYIIEFSFYLYSEFLWGGGGV
jgi:hypothetical protein